MSLQLRNPELVSLLSADLQPRYEPNFSWGQVMGILLVPQLRGFWPMSSVDDSRVVYDLGGQSRHLTNNNGATFALQGLAPYVDLNGTTQYLNRTDESGLDLLDDITCGAWVYFDAAASAVEEIIGKEAGAAARSYRLARNAAGNALFSVSHDGTNWVNVNSSGVPATTIPAETWTFVWGRFLSNGANSSVEVGINRTYWTQADASSAVFNSGADLTLGATGVPGAYMNGRITLAFLAAEYCPDAVLWNIYEQTRALFGA